MVVVVLGAIAIGSQVLLERTNGRTMAGGLSAIVIAAVVIGLVIGLMTWARRR